MISPIQLRNRWIKTLNLEISEKRVKDPQHSIDFSLNHRSCGDHWHVALLVTVTPVGEGNVVPIGGEIGFEGTFSIQDDFPEEQREKMLCMNGGAILYGAIREQYNTIACRSFHGPLDLPTIDARVFLKFAKSEPAKEECDQNND